MKQDYSRFSFRTKLWNINHYMVVNLINNIIYVCSSDGYLHETELDGWDRANNFLKICGYENI